MDHAVRVSQILLKTSNNPSIVFQFEKKVFDQMSAHPVFRILMVALIIIQ